jgi:hypothetical protein
VTKQSTFDPYAILEALDRERVSYVVVGGFARVVHGSAETTRGLDIVPSLREENLRRLARALDGLGASGRDRRPVDAASLTLVGADRNAHARGRAEDRPHAVGDARLRRPPHPFVSREPQPRRTPSDRLRRRLRAHARSERPRRR